MSSTAVMTLEDGWAQLKTFAIDKLIALLTDKEAQTKRPFTKKEYTDIYTLCYNMCTQKGPHNFSKQLYERHGETIRMYLQNVVLPALSDKHDKHLLDELVHWWKVHKVMNRWMQRFFMYLDRFYVKHQSLPTLETAGMQLFRSVVFANVRADVITAMIGMVNHMREHNGKDSTVLKTCVEVFRVMKPDLSVYTLKLELPLLAATQQYYGLKAREWLEANDVPAYLDRVEKVLKEEKARAESFLAEGSVRPLLAECRKALLEKQLEKLLSRRGSGLRELVREKRSETLHRMFELLKDVDRGHEMMADHLRAYVEELGNGIVSAREAALAGERKDVALDAAFVERVLNLHDRFRTMVGELFGNATLFQKAKREAFEAFMNKDVGKHSNAELLCTYTDWVLKTGGAKFGQQQIESELERLVAVFEFLSDKDMFSEVYRNLLAKRLLNRRSKSDDAEKLVISKLKQSCGSQFTSKLEGMINDLAIASTAQSKFSAALEEKGDEGVLPFPFTVQLLTTGFWPSPRQVELTLPPAMEHCVRTYTEYYLGKSHHRKLTWMHSLGAATVRGTFGSKVFDLQVTTLQAVALLAFNERDEMGFDELCTALNLDEAVGKRLVHSLSCGKFKVLRKVPASRVISTSDKFRFNGAFSCPMRHIRIPMASLNSNHNPKRVEEDRSIAIEAAIVRIMKARRMMRHQELITEVLHHLAFFRPNPKAIKQRIENLIDREYLERDEADRTVYRYLA